MSHAATREEPVTDTTMNQQNKNELMNTNLKDYLLPAVCLTLYVIRKKLQKKNFF